MSRFMLLLVIYLLQPNTEHRFEVVGDELSKTLCGIALTVYLKTKGPSGTHENGKLTEVEDPCRKPREFSAREPGHHIPSTRYSRLVQLIGLYRYCLSSIRTLINSFCKIDNQTIGLLQLYACNSIGSLFMLKDEIFSSEIT